MCGRERRCGELLGLHKAGLKVNDREDQIQKELYYQPDQDDEWFPEAIILRHSRSRWVMAESLIMGGQDLLVEASNCQLTKEICCCARESIGWIGRAGSTGLVLSKRNGGAGRGMNAVHMS